MEEPSLQDKIDALFDCIDEPFWYQKANKKICYQFDETTKQVKNNEFSCKMVTVKTPDSNTCDKISGACQLPKNCAFSAFIPEHQKLASRLISALCDLEDPDDFVAAAVYCHDNLNVNSSFYKYALMVAAVHHPIIKTLRLKLLTEISPASFIETVDVESMCRDEYYKKCQARENHDEPIDIEISKLKTSSPVNPEHKLWYFREDILANLHHWHWHIIYPANLTGAKEIKDRRGEMFYYMHQQIIARYNFERLCHGISRVKSFSNFTEPIEEGYFSKLTSENANRVFPGRHSGTKLSDVHRAEQEEFLPALSFQISDLEMWRDRILSSISDGEQGIVKKPDGSIETLDIDTLGNMVEASSISPNSDYYGDLHNLGHVAIAASHDPQGIHVEDLGVMAEVTTTMRDPLFYRWHSFINDVFTKHKDRLEPYKDNELAYNGIEIESVEVNTVECPETKNVLQTTWETQTLNIDNGLSFKPPRREDDIRVRVKYMRLQNEEFEITIKINNNTLEERWGTVRVFLAPKYNELGHEWIFNEQKNFFIELDRQVVQLTQGCQTIVLNSLNSSVTLKIPEDGETSRDSYCSCGWPQNLLIPMGNFQGMKCQLFVMISNYEDDKVEEPIHLSENTCKKSPAYCGLRDQKYPDKRAMGFPFDRRMSTPAEEQVPHSTLANFVENYTNMSTTDIEIKFTDNSADLQ